MPIQARSTLWRVLPLNISTWALGGFYASRAPSLVRTATGSDSNLIGGATVAALTLTGALMIVTLRNRPWAGGLTPTFGLVATTDGYGAVLIVLSLAALLGLMRQRPARVCSLDVK